MWEYHQLNATIEMSVNRGMTAMIEMSVDHS